MTRALPMRMDLRPTGLWLATALAAATCAATPVQPQAAKGGTVAKPAMVSMPAGGFRSLYGAGAAKEAGRDEAGAAARSNGAGASEAITRVAAFRIDRDPVTRGDFLAFVRAHPEWRRSAVRAVHADRATYLKDWRDDLDAGAAHDLREPVAWVSWSAARAYCKVQGKRLPTVDEWEYAAAASETLRDASRDREWVQGLTAHYARRGRALGPVTVLRPNAWGVRGLHEMTWEWVEDFNSVLVSDDSRGVGAREFDQVCASSAIGATDPTNYAAFLRHAVRAGLEGSSAMGTLGFRCAA